MDINRVVIHADDFEKDRDMFCEACRQPVNHRKCRNRQNHYYHKNGNPTFECENKISDWHKNMQALVDEKCREVTLKDPVSGKSTRSDVLLGKTTIEFQHSVLPIGTFNTRIQVNRNLNNKVCYVIDVKDKVIDGRLQKGYNGVYTWKRSLEYFKDLDIRGRWNEVGVWLDLGDGKFTRIVEIGTNNKGKKSCTLIRLASAGINYAEKGYLEESDFFNERIEDYPELGLYRYVKSKEYKNQSKCPAINENTMIEENNDGIAEESLVDERHETGAIEEDINNYGVIENLVRKIIPAGMQDKHLYGTGKYTISRLKFNGSFVQEKNG